MQMKISKRAIMCLISIQETNSEKRTIKFTSTSEQGCYEIRVTAHMEFSVMRLIFGVLFDTDHGTENRFSIRGLGEVR